MNGSWTAGWITSIQRREDNTAGRWNHAQQPRKKQNEASIDARRVDSSERRGRHDKDQSLSRTRTPHAALVVMGLDL